jgi:hypothetical protein
MEKVAETLARLEQKAREHEAREFLRLLPDRHPIRDFFVADILDWALKQTRAGFITLSSSDRRRKDWVHLIQCVRKTENQPVLVVYLNSL